MGHRTLEVQFHLPGGDETGIELRAVELGEGPVEFSRDQDEVGRVESVPGAKQRRQRQGLDRVGGKERHRLVAIDGTNPQAVVVGLEKRVRETPVEPLDEGVVEPRLGWEEARDPVGASLRDGLELVG